MDIEEQIAKIQDGRGQDVPELSGALERSLVLIDFLRMRVGKLERSDKVLRYHIQERADEPCHYGDNCPIGVRLNHGECDECKARRILEYADLEDEVR